MKTTTATTRFIMVLCMSLTLCHTSLQASTHTWPREDEDSFDSDSFTMRKAGVASLSLGVLFGMMSIPIGIISKYPHVVPSPVPQAYNPAFTEDQARLSLGLGLTGAGFFVLGAGCVATYQFLSYFRRVGAPVAAGVAGPSTFLPVIMHPAPPLHPAALAISANVGVLPSLVASTVDAPLAAIAAIEMPRNPRVTPTSSAPSVVPSPIAAANLDALLAPIAAIEMPRNPRVTPTSSAPSVVPSPRAAAILNTPSAPIAAIDMPGSPRRVTPTSPARSVVPSPRAAANLDAGDRRSLPRSPGSARSQHSLP